MMRVDSRDFSDLSNSRELKNSRRITGSSKRTQEKKQCQYPEYYQVILRCVPNGKVI